VSYSDIDVSRDLFEFTFVGKGESTLDDLEYSLELKEWTADKLEVQMHFTNPLRISTGINEDQLLLRVKNPLIFVSEITGHHLRIDNLDMTMPVPPQLPHSVNEEKLLEVAATASTTMNGFIIV